VEKEKGKRKKEKLYRGLLRREAFAAAGWKKKKEKEKRKNCIEDF